MSPSLLANLDLTFVQSKLMYLMLMRSGNYSFLPDLFDAIGEDNDMMIRLLSMFAGQRISFPTVEMITTYSRDITIFYRLANLSGRSFSTAVEEMSATYGVEGEEIKYLFRKMDGLAKAAGIDITARRI